MPFITREKASAIDAYDDIVSLLTDPLFMGGEVWTRLWHHNFSAATSIPAQHAAFGRTRQSMFRAPGKEGEGVFIGIGVSMDGGTAHWFPSMTSVYDALGIETGTHVGAWSSASVAYTVGQIVNRAGDPICWLCHTAHTSSAGLAPDSAPGSAYWRKADIALGGGVHEDALSSFAAGSLGKSASGVLRFWLIANAQRAIIVFKSPSSTVRYHVIHLGLLNRMEHITQSPYPGMVTANAFGEPYDSENSWNFPHRNDSFGRVLMPCYDAVLNVVTGRASWVGSAADWQGRPRLSPIYVSAESTPSGVLGVVDGITIPSLISGVLPEDVVTIGPQQHLLVPNVYRTAATTPYLAIKLE